MEIRDLRCLIAIAETGSFVRASQLLNVSQPSVSTRIRDLELELGVNLFERDSRGVKLTPEGIDLVQHARQIVRQVEYAEADIQKHLASPSGLVRVGVPTSLVKIVTPLLLDRCMVELPNVKLRIVESMSGYLVDWLRRARLDLALLFGDTPPAGVEAELLVLEQLLLAGADAKVLAPFQNSAGDVPFAQLAQARLILPGPEHGLRAVIDAQAKRERVKLTVWVEIDAFGEIQHLVSRGLGMTILSGAALGRADERPGLATARIVDPAIDRRIMLAKPAGRTRSRAEREVAHRVASVLVAQAGSGPWNAKPLVGG